MAPLAAAKGALLVTTTRKTVVGAVLAAAFTAAGATGALVLGGGAAPAPPAAAPPAPVPAAIPVGEGTALPTAPAGGSAPAAAGPGDLRELAVTAGEEAWLRSQLAAERRRREQSLFLPADGGLDILRRVEETGADPAEVLLDFATAAAHVRTGAGEVRRIFPEGDPTPVDMGQAAGEAAVIEFGPGRFVLKTPGDEWSNLRKGTRTLEIRGAGMDRTVLTLETYTLLLVWKGADLENLRVRDLTLEGSVAGMLDVRGRASIALENVRFRGWVAAGHAAPIGIGGGTFLAARGCEFVGGGRRSGFGVSLRGRALAVLEDCLFRDLDCAVKGGADGKGSVVRLLRCTFEGTPLTDGRRSDDGEGPDVSIDVRSGTARFGSPSWSDGERRGKWGWDYAVPPVEVALVPDTPACTLERLLSVAERVAREAGEVVVRVVLLEGGRDAEPRFGVRITALESGATRWVEVGADGLAPGPETKDPGGGGRPLPGEKLAACLPIQEAIRRSGIPVSTGASEIGFNGNTRGDPLAEIRSFPGWSTFAVRADTGEKVAEWK